MRTAETRILLVLCRNCARGSSNTRNKMSGDRLAFSLLSLGSEACFHCQGRKPGKELDLAKCLGEYGRGVGDPGTELKNEMWRNQITHCNDHLTQ